MKGVLGLHFQSRLFTLLVIASLLIQMGFTTPASATSQTSVQSALFTSCADQTEIPQAECDALVVLYNSTNGANWTNHTDWLETDTPCSWYGIGCQGGYITALYLSNNQLSGNIPHELGLLSELNTIELHYNQLSGSIPAELGNLTKLHSIEFISNHLTGTIPSEFGNLSNLYYLSLRQNLLSGSIPSTLGNLTNLSYLYLDDDQFSGDIPPHLGNLSSLTYLSLRGNQLSGTVPDEISNLTQLVYLDLTSNQLSGNLPSNIGNLVNLTYLATASNSMKGEIPVSITALTNLGILILSCGLNSADPVVIEFLNTKSPGWQNSRCSIGAGSISGHVYQEDGITPIPGAWVYAMDKNFQYVNGSTTDLEGSYQINSLPSSEYYLAVQAPGYGGVYYDNGYDDPSATPVTVTEPADTPNINFELSPEATISGYVYQSDGITPLADAQIQVWPKNGGQIRSTTTDVNGNFIVGGLSTGNYIAQAQATGYPTEFKEVSVSAGTMTNGVDFTLYQGGSISGHVYELDGVTPVANATVNVHLNDQNDTVTSTSTDEQGYYSVEVTPGNDYKLDVWANGYLRTFYSNVADWESATKISVLAGQTTSGIDVHLIKADSYITGRVTYEDGSPAANVWMEAFHQEDGWFVGINANKNGEYSIPVIAGTWRVFPYNPPFTAEGRDVPVSSGSTIRDFNFTLYLAGSISGQVYESDGITPLSGVEICNWDYDTGEQFACTSTAQDGTYILQDLPSGDYRIRANKSGWSWQFYSGTIQWDEATRVSVIDGQETSGINFSMEPGGDISGYVYDADGITPLANMRVHLVRRNGTGWPTCTDPNGFYILSNVPHDVEWQVNAGGGDNYCGGSSSFSSQFWDHVSGWEDATSLIINSAHPNYMNINFTLEQGGSISGHVYELDGVTPIANAEVSVRLNDENDTVASASTDEQGYYIVNVPQGNDYKVDVWANGYLRTYYSDAAVWETATKISVLAEQNTSGIDFHLIKVDSYITGRVTHEDGSPFANIWMEAFHEDGWFVGISANENGEYTIPVIAGTWEVFPYNPPLVAEKKNVSVSTGSTVSDIDFTVYPGGSISGTVHDANGNPIPGANVCATNNATNQDVCKPADVGGNYILSGITIGDYRVSAWAPGWAWKYYNDTYNWMLAEHISIAPGTTIPNVNFVLVPAGTIKGTVYEADGTTPIANMAVSLLGPDYALKDCTNTNGQFTFDSIPQGVQFRVSAVPSWRCNGEPEGYVHEYWQNMHSLDDATAILLSQGTPIYDSVVFTLDPGETASGIIGTGGGSVSTPNGTVHINVPSGSISSEIPFTITDGGGNYQVATAEGEWDVVMSTTIGPEGTVFADPATLTFQWSDSDNDGIVDGTNLHENNIVLLKDGEVITAVCEVNSSCDTESNTLTVQVTSLSLFELAVPTDTTPPSITWLGEISNGDSFYFGFVPPEPTCTASDDLSGIDGACTVSGYASTVGTHTLTATARDRAGNLASETRSYTILAWTLKGFYQPVDMNGIYNTIKKGSTVPFKFEAFAGSIELVNTTYIQNFLYIQTSCTASAITDDIETTTTGGTNLRYDSVTGQFVYNWKTPNAAGKCYQVTITTIDGSSLVAYFKLK